MKQLPTICLTFDLEEFDLPIEFNQVISEKQQMDISSMGMDALMPLLDRFNLASTFFTTAHYAERNQERMQLLAGKHEIASHSYFHSAFEKNDLKKSKETLEKICGTEVIGFRMPRMASVNYADLKAAGYRYDSSLNPTWIPGRYNHLRAQKNIHTKNDVIVFPASVSPNWRIPLFWLTFKKMPITWYCQQVQRALNAYGYVNLYFHPWEFTDISGFSVPPYIAYQPELMRDKLTFFLQHFQGKADFKSLRSQLNL